MKTLVIHPSDASTDFLKKIYEGKGYTVINHNISDKELVAAIKAHGRIMMLGHGMTTGLIGYGRFIINSEHVYLLREKESIGIWCNADQFFNNYKLRGFYSGMFLSEVEECKCYKIKASQEEVTFSNELFASEFRKVERMINCFNLIKESYNGESSVIKFNNTRLYYRDEESNVNDTDLRDELLVF